MMKFFQSKIYSGKEAELRLAERAQKGVSIDHDFAVISSLCTVISATVSARASATEFHSDHSQAFDIKYSALEHS